MTALFDVEYGYDAVGNRLFTRNLTPGLEERSELYECDQRHRLRRMDRGKTAAIPSLSGRATRPPVLVSPIADNDLAAAQDWTVLDRRGNWNEFAEMIGAVPVTTTQTRTRNGVNEYQAIDPDGPGPQSPVALTHDANGNVTLDPTASNLGDGEGGVPDPSGQVYAYDEENRLTAVRRASDNALLLEIRYDAVGRRVSSADYLAAGDPCGGPPALTRHIYAALETLEEHLSCDGGTNYALAREFVWGDRFPQPVALITHGGTGGAAGQIPTNWRPSNLGPGGKTRLITAVAAKCGATKSPTVVRAIKATRGVAGGVKTTVIGAGATAAAIEAACAALCIEF